MLSPVKYVRTLLMMGTSVLALSSPLMASQKPDDIGLSSPLSKQAIPQLRGLADNTFYSFTEVSLQGDAARGFVVLTSSLPHNANNNAQFSLRTQAINLVQNQHNNEIIRRLVCPEIIEAFRDNQWPEGFLDDADNRAQWQQLTQSLASSERQQQLEAWQGLKMLVQGYSDPLANSSLKASVQNSETQLAASEQELRDYSSQPSTITRYVQCALNDPNYWLCYHLGLRGLTGMLDVMSELTNTQTHIWHLVDVKKSSLKQVYSTGMPTYHKQSVHLLHKPTTRYYSLLKINTETDALAYIMDLQEAKSEATQQIQQLNTHNKSLEQAKNEHLIEIKKQQNIIKQLLGQTFSPYVAGEIYHVINRSQKPTLNLSKDKVTNADMTKLPLILSFLELNSHLIELNLSSKKIGDEDSKAIGYMLANNTTLRTLNLYNNMIGDEGTKNIMHSLATNSTLQTLYLNQNRISTEGAKIIGCALANNIMLQTLDLSNDESGSSIRFMHGNVNRIGAEGSKAIGQALTSNTTLHTLNLCSNFLGDEGGKAIGQALITNTTLQTLMLKHNNIGAEGGQMIRRALKQNTTLKFLYIYQNETYAPASNTIDEDIQSFIATQKSSLLHIC